MSLKPDTKAAGVKPKSKAVGSSSSSATRSTSPTLPSEYLQHSNSAYLTQAYRALSPILQRLQLGPYSRSSGAYNPYSSSSSATTWSPTEFLEARLALMLLTLDAKQKQDKLDEYVDEFQSRLTEQQNDVGQLLDQLFFCGAIDQFQPRTTPRPRVDPVKNQIIKQLADIDPDRWLAPHLQSVIVDLSNRARVSSGDLPATDASDNEELSDADYLKMLDAFASYSKRNPISSSAIITVSRPSN